MDAPKNDSAGTAAMPLWRAALWPMLVLATIILVSLVTHLGAHSPYTYGWAAMGSDKRGSEIDGMHVNPDSQDLHLIQLTEAFFKPCGIDIDSGNVGMPLHAFTVATMLGVARSFMGASLLVNACALLLLACAFTVTCVELRMRSGAILLAGVNFFLLPWVAHYAGQPLHYTFSICVNFVAALAIVRLAQKGDRNPWRFGLLAATMALNYDWYVFVGALVLFLVFVYRFERWYDYLKFALTAALPLLAWKKVVIWASGGAQINDLRGKQFFTPVKEAWFEILKHPIHNFYEPFVVSHIGADMMFRQVLGLIYWPLLFVVIIQLARLRPQLGPRHWAWFPVLLVVVYAGEQLATAGFDWENNPRRALPVVLAFGFALTFVIAKTYERRAWRAAFVALAIGSFTLTFADRLAASPAIQLLQVGEAARGERNWPMKFRDKRLTVDSLPLLPVDPPLALHRFRPKCEIRKIDRHATGEFWLSQVLLGGVLVAFAAVLRRNRWLPPYGVVAFVVFFAGSLAARLYLP